MSEPPPRPDSHAFALDFAGRFYPDFTALVLAGSAADGTDNERSDIDLIIIRPHCPVVERVFFTYEGQKIDLHVHDAQTAAATLRRCANDRQPGFIAQIRTGLVLPAPTPELSALQQQATAIWQAGPPPRSLAEMAQAGRYIRGLLDDLEDVDRLGRILITSRLAEFFIVLAAEKYRLWISLGRWNSYHLQQADPALAQRLAAALEAAVAGTAIAPLRALLREALAWHPQVNRDDFASRWPRAVILA